MPDLAIRERILAALYARLGNRLQPAGDGQAAVALRRNPGEDQTVELAVDQFDGGHERGTASAGEDNFDLTVELDLYTTDGAALSELYARCRDAIDVDRTFGNIAIESRERGLSEPVAGNVAGHPDIVAARLTIEIQFWTHDSNVRAQV